MLIIGSALIVAAAFAWAEYQNRQSEKAIYNASISTSTIESISPDLQTKDSDGDGLKDWEEVLLGTDPHNPDTDGDGTSDGKEVAAGRNPLIKGPNDNAKSVAETANAKKEALTQTDLVARDFFARYMELNQAGLAGDSQSQADLIGQVLKNGMVLSTPKLYAQKDILVSADDSAAAIKRYGNEVGAIFKKYSNPNARNEVVIAKESVEAEKPEALKEIDPIITTYKNIVTNLLKVSAPQSLAENHLKLVNSLSTLLFCAESLRKIDKDAVAGIQGTSLWLGAATDLNQSFITLKSSFTSNGITYAAGEPGSFFIIQQ